MVLDDDNPNKFKYKPHTRCKHTILKKYLSIWIPKLKEFSKYNLNKKKVRIFDCFAGRGSYPSGCDGLELYEIDSDVKRPGSPLLILDVISQYKEKLDEVDLILIEKEKNNMKALNDNLEKIQNLPDIINVYQKEGTFQNEVVDLMRETENISCPSFFFIDPFGFKDLEYEVMREISRPNKNEFLITLMSSYIKRFLESEKHKESLNKIFGKDRNKWVKDLMGLPPSYWEPVVKYYTKLLEEKMDMNYTLDYCINESNSNKPIYYLIYGTHESHGLSKMKEIMHREGLSGNLKWDKSADNGQKTFSDYNKNIKPLKDLLFNKFEGKKLSYRKVKDKTADLTKYDFIDKDYRKAVKKMEDEGKIKIIRPESSRGGVQENYIIKF